MHTKTTQRVLHPHDFGGSNPSGERKTRKVIILTTVTMVAEIVFGMLTGSMALLTDGWHMGTHAFALLISLAAYVFARRCAGNQKYTFGTVKFGVLAGYTSACLLGIAAAFIIYESVKRLIVPVAIAFDEAILVAVIGLVVNVVCVKILDAGHSHGEPEAHDHDHDHDHHHHDHNLRAAYLHVLADALTSVFAIVALLFGKFLGLGFLDPVMGILGGLLIARWSVGLLRSTAMILLDADVHEKTYDAIRREIESDSDDRIADLHVWRLSSNSVAAIVSVVSGRGRKAEHYRSRLAAIRDLKHLTVEVRECGDPECLCAAK